MKTIKIAIIVFFSVFSALGIGGIHDHYHIAVWIYGLALIFCVIAGWLKKNMIIAHLIWLLVCVSIALPIYRWGEYQKWRGDEAELQIRILAKKYRQLKATTIEPNQLGKRQP